MIKINRRLSFLRPLLAAALPIGLLAAGAMSAHADVVTVTGANGANAPALSPDRAGGAGGAATAATTTPTDPSNTASATGGGGGRGSLGHEGCFDQCVVWFDAGPGGAGGSATSQATTSIATGAAAATATSSGGSGGQGGSAGKAGKPGGTGGAGGSASSAALASTGDGAATATATSSGGRGGAGGPGFGGGGGIGGPGGTASAVASGQSTGDGPVVVSASASGGSGTFSGGSASASATGTALAGNVQANASATGGTGLTPGSAFAQSDAKNASGEVLTTASSAGGGVGTGAGVGSVSLDPADVGAGRAVSNAILTPKGKDIGVGAMSAAYGGSGAPVTHEATAIFDFRTSNGEALDLTLLSDSFAENSAGIAFDSLDLLVVDVITNKNLASFSLTSLSAAKTVFNADPVSLGAFGLGSQSIEIEYVLGYNSGTTAAPGDGFGFTYELVDPPSPSAAEPSTWAMMALGFAALGFAGWRGSRRGAAFGA